VEEISIHFGGLHAVDGVTFAIQPGQIHGLIGPNGAGKTTIFNCVTGFYHPTHGRIHFQTASSHTFAPINRPFRHRPHLPERPTLPWYERPRQYPGGDAQPHADRAAG
jgi:ABC-type branched-subunit amino acid transport system ATPase component